MHLYLAATKMYNRIIEWNNKSKPFNFFVLFLLFIVFIQAIWKKVQELGLSDDYVKNDKVQKFVWKMLALGNFD